MRLTVDAPRVTTLVASTAVLVSGLCAMRRPRGPAAVEVGAANGAEAARLAIADRRTHDLAATVLARRIGCATTVPGSIVAVGVAATARRDKVLRSVVGRNAVQMVGASCRPRERDAAPVAVARHASQLLKQHLAADGDLAVAHGERVVRQVERGAIRHSTSLAYPRTNDRDQLAKVLGVAKADPVHPDETSLFDLLDTTA